MRRKLLKLYDDLYAAYGAQGWWPAEAPFEVVIGAILVQATAWRNVTQAIDNLKAADLLTPDRLGDVPQDALETLIRSSGYYRMKAKKICAFLTYLRTHHRNCLESLFSQDTQALRVELLSIYGVGEETADSILLYAAGKPIFVVDRYTHRLLNRLGWFNGAYHYSRMQGLFMDALPHNVQLFNEYHALIVRHGAAMCQKTPRCEVCALGSRCAYPTANQPQR